MEQNDIDGGGLEAFPNGVTGLMQAAAECGLERVLGLLNSKPSLVRKQDANGKTALMYAAEKCCIDAINALLEHEKELKDNNGHTALYYALKGGCLEIAKTIMPHDDPTDKDGVTALMRAAARGDAEMVRLLVPLQKGLKDKDGNTAFVHALKNKRTDIATLLREHEAPSWTPLMCASFTGDLEAARGCPSDEGKKNSDGDTALIIAARAGHEDIVELLDSTDENGITALMRAAQRNDLATARALLPLQGRMKMTGSIEIGWTITKGTALMMAAAHGHTEMVKLLMGYEHGMRDRNRKTALIAAAQAGYIEVVRLLVDLEGRMKDSNGKTPLMWAEQKRHAEVAELLRGRDILTPLMIAARDGRSETVKKKLDEARLRSKYGLTALMFAAANDHLGCVKELLEHEKYVRDDNGWTALMWAAANGHLGCVKELLEHEKYARDGNGWTALMHAVQNGHLGCVKKLLVAENDMRNNDGETALNIAISMRDEANGEERGKYEGIIAAILQGQNGN